MGQRDRRQTPRLEDVLHLVDGHAEELAADLEGDEVARCAGLVAHAARASAPMCVLIADMRPTRSYLCARASNTSPLSRSASGAVARPTTGVVRHCGSFFTA